MDYHKIGLFVSKLGLFYKNFKFKALERPILAIGVLADNFDHQCPIPFPSLPFFLCIFVFYTSFEFALMERTFQCIRDPLRPLFALTIGESLERKKIWNLLFDNVIWLHL